MTGHRPYREIQERRRSGAAGTHGPKSSDRYNTEREAREQEEKDTGMDEYQVIIGERDHIIALLEDDHMRKVDGSGFDMDLSEADFSYVVVQGVFNKGARYSVSIRRMDGEGGGLDFRSIVSEQIMDMLAMNYRNGNKTCAFPLSWQEGMEDLADAGFMDFWLQDGCLIAELTETGLKSMELSDGGNPS